MRVDEVLALTGLDQAAGRAVGGFSLGMRQRLALASALIGDPDLLVLDEPFNGLDPGGITTLRAFLCGFAASGRTVLLSSHLLAEIEQTADDAIIIDHGRLVRAAPLADLLPGQPKAASQSPRVDLETVFASLIHPEETS